MGMARGGGHGMTRMITEWGSVVLVLSAAVLVIVIDARAAGLLVVHGARGFNTKTRRARRFFKRGLARGGFSQRR